MRVRGHRLGPRAAGRAGLRCAHPAAGLPDPGGPRGHSRTCSEGAGCWPAASPAQSCVRQPDGLGLFQPAACSFDLAQLGQGVLESTASVPTRPAQTSPGAGFPSSPVGREGVLGQMWPWGASRLWRQLGGETARGARSQERTYVASFCAKCSEGQGSGAVGSASGEEEWAPGALSPRRRVSVSAGL